MNSSEGRPGSSGAGGDPGADRPRRPRVRESVAQATERIQEIIDTAERVAEEIQHDAEAEAKRYLADRRGEADRIAAEQAERLEASLAGLRGHLTRVETEGARLLAELERALQELNAQARRAQDPGPPAEPAPPRAETVRRPAEPADQLAGELRDAALIRATQMAVSGSARAEIEAALHDELGIADPAPLVDQVLSG